MFLKKIIFFLIWMILNFLLLITPLHAAVLNKDPIITQLLVSSQGKTDIDINAKNGNGVFFLYVCLLDTTSYCLF